MSGIFIGNATKIFYNTDAGNNIPNAPTYVNIDELAAFPEVKIQSSMNEYETYNDEYSGILASNKTIQSVNIVVNYVPDNVTHVFLDSMFNSQTQFQIKVSLYESLTSVIQHYAILSGYVSTATLSGDQNSVVKKTYVFTAEDVIARGTITDMADLKLGDYGVGANGVDIPQYESATPSGNSFLKVPASQAQNPTGTDLLGIANVDNGNTTKLVMTESGTFSLYGKNQSSSWTQILTKPQSDSAYVPMARTVNGKALSTNITLTPADVSALALTGGTLTGNLNGTTATFTGAVSTGNLTAGTISGTTGTFTGAVSAGNLTGTTATFTGAVSTGNLTGTTATFTGAVSTGNLTAGTISGTTGTFTGAVQADSASITGAITGNSITLQNATIDELEVSGQTTLSDALTGATATFTGAVSTGNLTAGTISGTTGTFTGAVQADSLTLTTPLSIANGGTGATTADAARTNLVAAKSGVNSDITSLIGLTSALSTAQGGTGNANGTIGQLTTARTFLTNLGSTTAASFNGTANVTPGVTGTLPIANGGTGGTTAATARTALGLSNAAITQAVASTDTNNGLNKIPLLGSTYTPAQGQRAFTFASSNTPAFSGATDGTWTTPLVISNGNNNSAAAAIVFIRDGNFANYFGIDQDNQWAVGGWSSGANRYRLWTESNTTVDGNGFIKRASPIVRITNSVEKMADSFTDNNFKISGSGAANVEAEGCVIERITTGIYKITGSLGLSLDGWQIEIPQDANGNRLCFVETQQDQNGIITLIVSKRRFDVDTAMIVAGEAMDIPDGRWIDLRLNMPEDSIFNQNMRKSEEDMKLILDSENNK